MSAMNGESANRFISALVKSLQTLCHGYVDFNDGIEIIGHLYLNIDSGPSFDYIVKEKVCKNADSGTLFVSKSFQAHSPPGEVISRHDDSNRIQSAISSMSNVFPGQPTQKAHHPNPGKRKKDHTGNYNLQPTYTHNSLQPSSSSSSSAHFNMSASSSKQANRAQSDSEHLNNFSHSEFFGGADNHGSGVGMDEEDDLALDVTFVKDEYQRNSSDQRRVSARLSQGSNHSNMQMNYPPNHNQAPQQFATGSGGDMDQGFQDPSQMDIGQQSGQGPPNPRNNANAGPPHPMQEGVKPLCGYVHPDDTKKWQMIELIAGSSVYIHQENYSVVLSKTRLDRPDGKAMTRYLMSCFWRGSDLVGTTIADPPKPNQRSLDKGIVNAIIDFVCQYSTELATDIRRTIQQKIGYARFYFLKKSQDPESAKASPALISCDASPRRMSMEMTRRETGAATTSVGSDDQGLSGVGSGKRGRKVKSTQSNLFSGNSPVSHGQSDIEGLHPSEQDADDIDEIMTMNTSPCLAPSSVGIRMPSDIPHPGPQLANEEINRHMSATEMSGGAEFPPMTHAGQGHINSSLSSSRLSDDLPSRSHDNHSPQEAGSISKRTHNENIERTFTARRELDAGGSHSQHGREGNLSDLAQRMGNVPLAAQRAYLDMLNFYPNN